MTKNLSVCWYELEPIVDHSGKPVMFELLYRSHSKMPKNKGDWRRWYQRICCDLDHLLEEPVPAVSINLDSSHLLDMKVIASVFAAGKKHGDRLHIELRNPGSRYQNRVDQALVMLRDSLDVQICIDGVSAGVDMQRLLKLKPDWVKITPASFHRSIASTEGCQKLGALIAQLRNAGVKVAIVGIEKQAHEQLARRLGAELTQGHHWNDKCLNGKNVEAIIYNSAESSSDISLIRHLVAEHEKNRASSSGAAPPWATKVRELVSQKASYLTNMSNAGDYIEADSGYV